MPRLAYGSGCLAKSHLALRDPGGGGVVLGEVKKFFPNEKYIFIGDRTMEGGNDYPLAKIMHSQENCLVFQAGAPSAEDGYKDTQRILEELDNNG